MLASASTIRPRTRARARRRSDGAGRAPKTPRARRAGSGGAVLGARWPAGAARRANGGRRSVPRSPTSRRSGVVSRAVGGPPADAVRRLAGAARHGHRRPAGTDVTSQHGRARRDRSRPLRADEEHGERRRVGARFAVATGRGRQRASHSVRSAPRPHRGSGSRWCSARSRAALAAVLAVLALPSFPTRRVAVAHARPRRTRCAPARGAARRPTARSSCCGRCATIVALVLVDRADAERIPPLAEGRRSRRAPPRSAPGRGDHRGDRRRRPRSRSCRRSPISSGGTIVARRAPVARRRDRRRPESLRSSRRARHDEPAPACRNASCSRSTRPCRSSGGARCSTSATGRELVAHRRRPPATPSTVRRHV